MKQIAMLASLALASLVASPAALSDDVAAERANLANTRIRAEEELRARAEAEQAEKLSKVQVEASPENSPVKPAEPETPAASRIEMSHALEQLRELGALKDAGYLTDEEFRLLKEKILDGAL
jgi:hypothetical protein